MSRVIILQSRPKTVEAFMNGIWIGFGAAVALFALLHIVGVV